MSLLAIIPAKKNSRRLPNKNMLPIGGVPMVVRAIRCAKESGIFDGVVVSSEDLEILNVARGAGARTNWRLPQLSDDEVQTAAVVFYALCALDLEYDAFCVLNPTSPLRTPEELREAYAKFIKDGVGCLASGRFNGHDGDFLFWKTLPFLRYISRSIIPPDASWMIGSGVDINTQEDYDLAKSLSSCS